MRLLLITALALFLSACGGGEEPTNNSAMPAPTPTPGPSLGGVQLDAPIRAGGASPFWEVYLAPGTITFADAPEAAPVDFYPTSPTLASGEASLQTQTIEGEPVTVRLAAQPCASGSATLPLTAIVRIGNRDLKGCAGPTERRVSAGATPTPTPSPAPTPLAASATE